MIQILPVPEERLAAFCQEKGLAPGNAPLRGYTAAAGGEILGWCLVEEGEPCLVLGEEAEEPQLGDGLLRAALYPLYEKGIKGYRFARLPAGSLPGGYVLQGEGSLSDLFTPCCERRKDQ